MAHNIPPHLVIQKQFDMGEEDTSEKMAATIALKAAKKELRSLMKQKLSTVSQDSINTQSKSSHRQLSLSFD